METTLDFVAFRITVHPHPRIPLLASREPKPAILRATIEEAPTGSSNRGALWRIGNVTRLGPGDGLYFRLGRVRQVQLPQTDQDGNFVDEEFDVAPYTHGVVDVENELVALARNSQLAPTPESLGRALGRLLSQSSAAQVRNVVIECAPLKNPANFLVRLRAAHVVHRLWVLNRRPNPFDVDKDFVQPTSRVAEGIGADTYRTEWRGPALDVQRSEVEEIIKSTAATGGNAGARLQDTVKSKPDNVSLTTNLGSFSASVDLQANLFESSKVVLHSLRELYDLIRRRR